MLIISLVDGLSSGNMRSKMCKFIFLADFWLSAQWQLGRGYIFEQNIVLLGFFFGGRETFFPKISQRGESVIFSTLCLGWWAHDIKRHVRYRLLTQHEL